MGLNLLIMYRVVALGDWAGGVVDRLRQNATYDDIRFVFCNADEGKLMTHGIERDEHILLRDIAQCREAIHDDCELMAVLVVNLEEIAREYVIEIIYELWGYADYTYCFASGTGLEDITSVGGKYAELFKWITDYSRITVFQDNSRLPQGLDCYNGTALLLRLVIKHPRNGKSDVSKNAPLGVWATEKQMFMVLQAVYSNCIDLEGYSDADTFTFHESTHEY